MINTSMKAELHQTNSHHKFLKINAYLNTYAHTCMIKFCEFQIKTNHHITVYKFLLPSMLRQYWFSVKNCKTL